MNPFYAATNNQPNMMQMLNQLKQNPMQFLMQRKFNLPQDINTNNPNDIINHLVSSGQIPQSIYNQARQMAQQMGMK